MDRVLADCYAQRAAEAHRDGDSLAEEFWQSAADQKRKGA
jgi:hypothetical protein